MKATGRDLDNTTVIVDITTAIVLEPPLTRHPPLPTHAELQVLRVLWSRGAATVREVHDALYGAEGPGYTTALKLLQNLRSKGLVSRDEEARQHIYRAVAPEKSTLEGVVRSLIDRSFEGSAGALALHALGAKRATPAELARLKALIARMESEGEEDR
jgi:BlaI family transcriptional regulator, penicillinase repressor